MQLTVPHRGDLHGRFTTVRSLIVRTEAGFEVDFDPATGRIFDQGTIRASATPTAPVQFQRNVPSPQDWVLVLERVMNE